MNKKNLHSAELPTLILFGNSLTIERTNDGKTPKYRHFRIRKNKNFNEAVIDELYEYINHAHEGAREVLRDLYKDEESFDPRRRDSQPEKSSDSQKLDKLMELKIGYPHKLPSTTHKEYFGEILAGLIAQYYAQDDECKWEVPVYLFRMHDAAFQWLEKKMSSSDGKNKVVGRTGDDALGFARDKNGQIIAWLACEAKCTAKNYSKMISDNHIKLSEDMLIPTSITRIIQALKDYQDDEYSRNWIRQLRKYLGDNLSNCSAVRNDFGLYVHGKMPRDKHTLIPTDEPHPSYEGGRDLTSAEFHLPDVNEIISALYERMKNHHEGRQRNRHRADRKIRKSENCGNP